MLSAERVFLGLFLFDLSAAALRIHSEQESSEDDRKVEEHTETSWLRKGSDATLLPFLKHKRRKIDYDATTYAADVKTHPNEKFFPLIYSQTHVDSMFKIGDNWYTWSIERRTDGSTAVNYYICYDEPQKCDDVGWERTETSPKCAIEIYWLLPGDRACVNSFGTTAPRSAPHSGLCDGAEQMKVSDITKACGPRVHTTWRFVRTRRARRRPQAGGPPTPAAPYPAAAADVNALICDNADECIVNVEYRIHHDRITLTIHEDVKGHIFKSMLTRDSAPPEEKEKVTSHKSAAAPENRIPHHSGKGETARKFFHSHTKSKTAESSARLHGEPNFPQANRRKPAKTTQENSSEDVSE